MAQAKKDRLRAERRTLRIRKSIKEGSDLTTLRLVVFRSLKHIYAQVVDDIKGVTVASSSTLQLTLKDGDKKSFAYQVGKDVAKRLKDMGTQKVRFDRGNKRYHGRVKSLVEGVREVGIKV